MFEFQESSYHLIVLQSLKHAVNEQSCALKNQYEFLCFSFCVFIIGFLQ